MPLEPDSSRAADEIARRQRVDALCDRFEQQWGASAAPRLEEILAEADPADRDLALTELLRMELELLVKDNQQVDQQEYLVRFQDQKAIVKLVFNGLNSDQDNARDDDLDPTEDLVPDGNARARSKGRLSKKIPKTIDRFQVLRELGEGGFGIVYLAHDPLAKRNVAIKVPKPEQLTTAELELFLEDVRTASQLAHPGIVPIYEVSDSPTAYVVQELMEGGDLKDYAKRTLSPKEVVSLMIPIAEAVGFAHQHGYTHLDLKPANILLRKDGQPCVADFGLAVHESEQWSKAGRLAGTIPYMSPEQAAGEVHRLDGRSDIWSLGVILYELLTQKRPFTDRPTERLLNEIRYRDPRPIRQHDPALPAELGRIVQCCLAKSALERYQSAADLVDDLRDWFDLQSTSDPNLERTPVNEPLAIIPQGLRSFEAEHSGFFLQLLPGPHDRDGLPNRVRFWKKQIEQGDPDATFSVGLMYGSSGCGKSSLVKAGLLPNLDAHVTPVYLEATAGDTEVRLIKGLRKICPNAPEDKDMPDLMAWARKRFKTSGRKILFVIDQFEQWLHTHSLDRSEQLIKALRHCDGANVQCLVLVRDDFWMSATNFMRALDITLTEGFNSAAVDLFDRDHAKHVLTLLGRAHGKLPSEAEELTDEHSQFLDRAVEDLASDGKVVCVRLSVFAEMMKGRVWNEKSLQDIGGTEGVGVSFLDETFSASTSPPAYRRHRGAIRAVLEALLPDAGSDIKGRMKSYSDLLAASGYSGRGADFDEVLAILDGNVRLITPTEPDGSDASGLEEPKYYQLTHDFLVPSLRDWLTREKRETLRGRAELRLAERAALWRSKKEDRQLPSAWEYARIRLFTPPSRWSTIERSMMRRADRVRGVQFFATAFVALGLIVGGAAYHQGTQRGIANGHVQSLLDTEPAGLEAFVKLVKERQAYAIPSLQMEFDDRKNSDQRRLHAACALRELGERIEFPFDLIATCDPGECVNIVRALKSGGQDQEQLKNEFQDLKDALEPSRGPNGQEIGRRSRADVAHAARLAIVLLHLGHDSAALELLRSRKEPMRRTVFIETFPEWHGDLNELRNAAANWKYADRQDLLSGLALSIGSVAEAVVREHGGREGTAQELQERLGNWSGLLQEWWKNCPSGGVHSASKWALSQMGEEPKLSFLGPSSPDINRDWYVTRETNLSMVRIPPTSLDQEDGARTSDAADGFWISDREITVALFQQFAQSDNLENWVGPFRFQGVSSGEQEDHPVQQVSWFEAIRFCNWLSRKESAQGAVLQECYEIERSESGELVATPVAGANGFRLPKEAEWVRACRAGTSTRYFFGDEPRDFADYGHANSPTGSTITVGQKRCNLWGLFDVHGNVSEWCQSRQTLGGGFNLPSSYATSASKTNPAGANSRAYSRGFRVIRVR